MIQQRKKKISITKSEIKRKSLKQVNTLKTSMQKSGKKVVDEIKTNYVVLNQTKTYKCLQSSNTNNSAIKVPSKFPPQKVNESQPLFSADVSGNAAHSNSKQT